MKPAYFLLVGGLCLTSASAAYLASQLSDERARSERLEARVAELERTRSPFSLASAERRPMLLAAASVPPAASAPAPAAPAAAVPVERSEAPARAVTEPGERKLPPNFEEMRRRQAALWRDPEYRAAARAQRRVGMERRHPGLAEELKLTAEEADKFFDLRAEHEIRNNEAMAKFAFDGSAPSEQQQEEMRRMNDEMRRRNDREIAALLGEERVAQFREYQKTIPARFEVQRVNEELKTAGTALSREQADRLTKIYMEEYQRMSVEANELGRVVRSSSERPDPQVMLQLAEKELGRQLARHKAVLNAASGVLDAGQLEVLEKSFERRATMQRAQLRMQRAQMAAGGSESFGIAYSGDL